MYKEAREGWFLADTGTTEEQWYREIIRELQLRGKFIADWSIHDPSRNQG
jgi:hypothetical protein